MKLFIFLNLVALALLLSPRTANAQVYGESYVSSFPEGNTAEIHSSSMAYSDGYYNPGVVATLYGPAGPACASDWAGGWGEAGNWSYMAEVDLSCTVSVSGYAYLDAQYYSHDESDGPDDMGGEVGEDYDDTAVSLDPTPWITGIDPSSWAPDNTGGQSFAISGGGFGTSPSISITGDVGSWSIADHTDTSISAWVDLSNSSGGNATVTVTSNGYGGMSFLPGPQNNSPTSPSADAQITAPAFRPAQLVVTSNGDCYWTNGTQYTVGYTRVITYQVVGPNGQIFNGAVPTVFENVQPTGGSTIRGGGVWWRGDNSIDPHGVFTDYLTTNGNPWGTANQSFSATDSIGNVGIFVNIGGSPYSVLSNYYSNSLVTVAGSYPPRQCHDGDPR